jgi:hypothetical protein
VNKYVIFISKTETIDVYADYVYSGLHSVVFYKNTVVDGRVVRQEEKAGFSISNIVGWKLEV